MIKREYPETQEKPLKRIKIEDEYLFNFLIENNSKKSMNHLTIFQKIMAFTKDFAEFVSFIIEENQMTIYVVTTNHVIFCNFFLRKSFFSSYEVCFDQERTKSIVINFNSTALDELSKISLTGESNCCLKICKKKIVKGLDNVHFFVVKETCTTDVEIPLILLPENEGFFEAPEPYGVNIEISSVLLMKEMKEMDSGKVLKFTFAKDSFIMESERLKKRMNPKLYKFDNDFENNEDYSVYYGLVDFLKLITKLTFVEKVNLTFPLKENAGNPVAIHFKIANLSPTPFNEEELQITSEDDEESKKEKLKKRADVEFNKYHVYSKFYYCSKIVDQEEE